MKLLQEHACCCECEHIGSFVAALCRLGVQALNHRMQQQQARSQSLATSCWHHTDTAVDMSAHMAALQGVADQYSFQPTFTGQQPADTSYVGPRLLQAHPLSPDGASRSRQRSVGTYPAEVSGILLCSAPGVSKASPCSQ
jgi:hypothetical protein